MIKIFVSHPTTGNPRHDEKVSALLHKEIVSKHFGVNPVAFSAFNVIVPYKVDGKDIETSSNLIYIQKEHPKEIWLYGDRIDDQMKAEINMAYVMKIPIVPKNQHIEAEFNKLGLEQKSNYGEIYFWMFIAAMVIVLTALVFFGLRWVDGLAQ